MRLQKITISFIFFMLGFYIQTQAQLVVTAATGISPLQLVQNTLVGTGVTVSNVKFNSSFGLIASNQIGSFAATATNLGFTSGLILASGGVSGAVGPNISGSTTTPFTGTAITDPQLQALVPTYTVNDAAVLEFDFIPVSDTIKFRYVFASEEYPEFVCSTFNDVFGFFITGMNPSGPAYVNKNIALIPGTTFPVTINSLNSGSPGAGYLASGCSSLAYSAFYVNNSGVSIQYDGFTTILTAWALVIPCTSYHMKLAVADCGDQAYDSGVFLEANSFSSPLVTIHPTFSSPTASVQNAIEGCNNMILTFKYPYNVTYPYQIPVISVGGTATNGVDYPLLPNTLTIPTGCDSVRLIISPIYDHISEGMETVKLVFQTSVCGDYDTVIFNIQNYDSLTARAYGDTTLCNDHAQLSIVTQNGVQPYQYFWSNAAGNTAVVNPSLTATTLFHITVRDACYNTATDSVLVVIDCNFARAGPDTTICLGGSAKLHASMDTTVYHSSGIPSFLWNTGDTTAIVYVNPTVTTTYIVTVSDIFSDKDTVTVFVIPLPVVTATTAVPTICFGDSTMLHASGAVSYFWTSDINDFSLTGKQTLINPVVSPMLTTSYTVKGTDINSCSNTASIVIHISPSPNPQIVAYPNPVSVFDPTVHIFDATNGNNSYIWFFGDGTNSTQTNVYHTYNDQDTGRYLVTVIASNAYGCVDTAEVWVIVRPDCTFYVPNSFTPNGDGLNDIFKVYGMGILEFEINIHDRWGKLIYTSTDMSLGWDGKINGEMSPDGAYAYMIIYKDNTGIRHTKSGTISIVH
ncbi:MAG: choice-of-anchor L domain-containing protein [Bacteroidales bacterium]